MSEFRFTILGVPPTVNHSYHIIYTGGRCPACGRGHARLAKAPGVETWQEAVAWQTKAARPSGWMPGRRVRISVTYWMPRAGRDAHNSAKALLDGIAHGLGVDDAGFLLHENSIEVDRANPRLEVTVSNE